MLPASWIPHRRSDGETIGWIEIDGDDVAAFDLLGRRLTPEGVDWHEAEQVLERRGIGYLADQYTLTTPYGEHLPVRIGEATTEQVTVVVDEFGGASAVGADPDTYVLPFPVPPGTLRAYVRPPVDLGPWSDDEGRPIECGHPERFEPVVTTGRALLDHLERSYDVERTEESVDGRTRVTLTPRSGRGAALTREFPLTGLPGVDLGAGHRYRMVWPGCGCDACDDAVPDLLDDLEEVVFAIVEGRMSEWRSGPKRDMPWRFHVAFDAIRTHGGYEAGWSARGPEPFELPTKPHRWGPWPLRTD